MKEILKYLRSVNGFSQQVVADAVGVSRQSYNKYEAGAVIPSDRVVSKIAEFYKVDLNFIKANKVPDVPGKEKTPLYSQAEKNYGAMAVASPAPAYGAVTEKTSATAVDVAEKEEKEAERLKTYEAYYSHGNIVLKHNDLNLREGQNLQITVRAETEEEEQARRERAWKTMKDFLESRPFTYEGVDPDYDTLRWEAMKEKYGPF
ncbi:MAG: helix-turn-helix transcriptional regulator [Treponema sp.]